MLVLAPPPQPPPPPRPPQPLAPQALAPASPPRLQPVGCVVLAVLAQHHLALQLVLAHELLAHVGLFLLNLVQHLVV